MTAIGPVDLLCRDAAGATVAVEVKRRGEIDGVEQLTRYLELLEPRPAADAGDGGVRRAADQAAGPHAGRGPGDPVRGRRLRRAARPAERRPAAVLGPCGHWDHGRVARSNRHRRPDHVPLRSAGHVRAESGPDGDWVVRSVPGSSSTKDYRCPGCDQLITAGTGAPRDVARGRARVGRPTGGTGTAGAGRTGCTAGRAGGAESSGSRLQRRVDPLLWRLRRRCVGRRASVVGSDCSGTSRTTVCGAAVGTGWVIGSAGSSESAAGSAAGSGVAGSAGGCGAGSTAGGTGAAFTAGAGGAASTAGGRRIGCQAVDGRREL